MLAEFLNGDIRGSKPISLLCNQEGAGTESVDQHEAALFLGGGARALTGERTLNPGVISGRGSNQVSSMARARFPGKLELLKVAPF